MHGLRTAPFAVLFELNFALHQLLVLGRPIVNALAFVAGQFYESILRHAGHYSRDRLIGQNAPPVWVGKERALWAACILGT